MKGRLQDKVALITGAASGIGRAIADRFVAEGAIIVMTDRDAEKLRAAYKELCADNSMHLALPLDVTLESAWTEAVSVVGARFGRLDILVNNAGYARAGLVTETPLAEWREMTAVLLDSVFLGAKHAIPWLAKSRAGSIVNISSIIGIVSAPRTGAYSAAKAGVWAFTKSLALECAALGYAIRANSVHPGQVETPLLAHNVGPDAGRAHIEAKIPLGRLGTPREIADAVVFLASDEASFITGTELVADGGYTAQ